ncbi:OmpA/MotB family protein [Desulfogranum japonicum]|uniref:OmpA/MotB family protein n=1 Tax=Desulfogranum japonicum TaxID=231447 RepID=UPI0004048204|nr:flagellar motor protein MotB [Desulfogranum japonicum]
MEDNNRKDTEAIPIDQSKGISDEEPLIQEVVSRPPADYHATISQPVFVIEDSFYRSRTPRSVHWSIAWSDLMMTMFILFLTLFIYQLAHREFLSQDKPEVVSGSVISVPPKTDPFTVPFHPISPQLSEHKADKLKTLESAKPETPEEITDIIEEPVQDRPIPPLTPQPKPISPSMNIGDLTIAQKTPGSPEISQEPEKKITDDKATPTAKSLQQGQREHKEIISEIYDLSQLTVAEEKLERFASVELIPDKAMRIILTGDLLFATGEADLTQSAQISLGKLSPIIAQTPYMINVVGHTDSVPMHSSLYPTNWELSVARASKVARFLIEEMGISGSQIVVSGFSYFRPVKPNTTEENRRANRRVEIILSKETPPVIHSDQPKLSAP